MRNLKEKTGAFRLRRLGKSYGFISQQLQIPKSTLSSWFAELNWSQRIRSQLIENRKEKAKKQIQLMNAARKKRLENYYLQAEREAEKEFYFLKKNRLFIAGVMIYWGEGDKLLKNGQLRISNIDPMMINIFVQFLKNIFKINSGKIRIWLLLYPDLRKDRCVRYWLRKTGLPKTCFTKPVVIKRRGLKKKLSYGVCNVGITNKYLKTKLLKWIDLLVNEIVYCK
ncbi:MAG: hypothetical protein AB1721_02085 [Patescibacteria group bacterium]